MVAANSDTVRVAVVGRTLSGKSRYVSARFLRAPGECWPNVVVANPVGESRYFNGEVLPAERGATNAITRMDHDPERAFPFQMVPGLDPAFDFEFLLRYCLASGPDRVGGIVLVVEETAFWCGEYPQHSPRWLALASRIGRHSGLSLVYTGQRPSTIPRALTSQASHIVVAGRLSDPGDWRYLSEFTSPGFAQATDSGTPQSYLVWDVDTGRAWREELDGTARPIALPDADAAMLFAPEAPESEPLAEDPVTD